MASQAGVPRIWLRQELFEHGLAPIPGGSTITFPAILSFVQRHAGPRRDGLIAPQAWASASATHFGLDPARASLYLDMYWGVRCDLDPEERLQRVRAAAAGSSAGGSSGGGSSGGGSSGGGSSSGGSSGVGSSSVGSGRDAPVCELATLLYLQMYQRQQGRGSPRHGVDSMWPGGDPSRGGALSPQQSAALQGKATEDASQRAFVKAQLHEILQLYSSPAQLAGAAQASSGRVLSREQVDAAQFLLSGGLGYLQPRQRLSSLAPFWRSDDARLVPEAEVEQWVLSLLGPNPLLYPPIPSVSRGLHGIGAGGVTGHLAAPHSPHSPLITNQGVAASPAAGVHVIAAGPEELRAAIVGDDVGSAILPRPVTVYGANKKTIVLTDAEVGGANVRIVCCTNSFIYLLAHVRHVTVFGASHCTIVAGAVESVASVEMCSNVTFISCSRYVRVSNSNASTFYICTNQPPHLFGENHSLVFGPYNTHYPLLEEHLLAAGVSPRLESNLWDKPVVVSGGSGVAEGDQYAILEPSQFMPVTVPFTMPGPTCANPCELAQPFRAALEAKARAVEDVRTALRATKLGRDDQAEFQGFIQNQFKEWLSSTGNMRHIQDLLHMETHGVPTGGVSGQGGSGGRRDSE